MNLIHERWHRHPSLLALAFVLRNRIAAAMARPGRASFAIGAALAFFAAFVLVLRHAMKASGAIDAAAAHPIVAASMAAAVAFGIAAWTRREQERAHAGSWLAALPLSPRTLRAAFFLPVLVRLSGWVLAVALVPAIADESFSISPWQWLLGAISATVLGGISGWHLARWRRRGLAPKYVLRPLAAPRTSATPAPSLQPLGLWPLREWRAHAHAAHAARATAVLLLAIPQDTPLRAAVLMFCVGLSSFALASLVRETHRRVAAAAAWLRTTPLSPSLFAVRLLAPSMFVLVGGFVLAALLLAALGMAPGTASALAATSFALALLGWCCAFACRFAPQRFASASIPRAVLLLAIVQGVPPLAVPAWFLLCAQQWHRAIRLR